MKKIRIIFLSLMMIISMIPTNTLANHEPSKNPFEGLSVSILGDSISTYHGVSNNSSYNQTLSKNVGFYPVNDVTSQNKTWWQIVIDTLGMELCVNNSSGGGRILSDEKLSTISNGSFSSSLRNIAAYKDRCVNLHNQKNEKPDVILVFLGTNDFSYHVDAENCETCKQLLLCPTCLGTNTCEKCIQLSGLNPSFCPQSLGTSDISKDLIQVQEGSFVYATPQTTCEAYAIMLHKMKQMYPNAQIYCLGLLARRNPDNPKGYHDHGQPTSFNHEIKKVVESFDATYVDLENCIDSEATNFDQYIYDKAVHPNAAGMKKIANAVMDAMLGEDHEWHQVSTNLTDVKFDGDLIASSKMTYTAKLSPLSDYTKMSVNVTMNGEDITSSVYKEGIITIENVTGDIFITATGINAKPRNFHFELKGNELVSQENALTKLAGTVQNGVFMNARYKMEKSIILRHDRHWVLEWKGEGDGGFMLSKDVRTNDGNKYFFHRANHTLEAFGYWNFDESMNHNYGVCLKDVIDAGSHTYRLENRVNGNDNMVYLIVDNQDEYCLDNLYHGGNNQFKKEDWISGKDFVFNYIGTLELPLTNYKLEYLSIWEDRQPLEIITQPTSCEAELGETFAVSVEAKGEGLTYQWYVLERNTTTWIKSSITKDVYSSVMNETRAGRKIYCVITDKYGNSVTTDTVELILKESDELEIISQPTDSHAELGKYYYVKVNAKGKGLKYQWYVRNVGQTTWNKSDVTSHTYSNVMTLDRAGRELYCVVSDAYGNSVTTNIVKLIMIESDELGIVTQPSSVEAVVGKTYTVVVEAKGKGLTYEWYVKDVDSEWIKTDIQGHTYTDTMTLKQDNREIYCVIRDTYGNSVTSNVVKVKAIIHRIWNQWIEKVVLTAPTHPTYGGFTTGYYQQGQTFPGILYSSTNRDGTDALWNLNSSTYYSAIANPASLLYTVDNRGRVFNEAAWTGSVCSTTAMKALGYEIPYTTVELPMIFDQKEGHHIDDVEAGDVLWVKGHVAGVLDVIKENGQVNKVKIIEQASYVRVFEITRENWESYFNSHWTHIYRGDYKEQPLAIEYPENHSIIFERGNNTYVTDTSTMYFYIPTASTIYLTKDGITTSYDKNLFPTQIINNTTVYDLSLLFDGIGDYYFHTNENETDMIIKVIHPGTISVSNHTIQLSGYENCQPIYYRTIEIIDKKKNSVYNFFEAPEGYTSQAHAASWKPYNGDTFEIEDFPETEGWKVEVFYDTGYGWIRQLSSNVLTVEHEHSFTTYISNHDGTKTAKCDYCDEKDTIMDDILFGDVNDDQVVDTKDRMILARHLANWKGYEFINQVNADVNRDGKVNTLDRMILSRHLAKWEGYENLPYN